MKQTKGEEMKIETTKFSVEHHGSKIINSRNLGDYMLHNVDVDNQIIINDIAHTAIYQTGCGYLANDFDAPNDNLDLSAEADSSSLLVEIAYHLDEEKIQDLDEDDLEELSEMARTELGKADVLAIYTAINENLAAARSEFVDLELSDDVDDYEFDAEDDCDYLGYATLK